MAARLTVIISQSALRHCRNTDLEETLLTELMMTSGLDATLIGSLDAVQLDSTDYVCLSGFAQHIALVTSLSAPQVAEHWERLQLGGQIVQVGQVAAQAVRRVYHLPLELGIQPILAQLKQLLTDRTIQTVSLSLPKRSQSLDFNTAQEKSNSASTDSLEHSLSAPQTASPAREIPVIAVRETPKAPVLQVDEAELLEAEWPDLDRLVDDFDALDL